MLRKLEKTISVLLVIAMMFTYVAPWKALAIDESDTSLTGESDGADASVTGDPTPVSHDPYFDADGLYHVWTQVLTCTDETHHTHDASCNQSTEPVCGIEASDQTLTCTIELDHTHSVENGCYEEVSMRQYYYYQYTEGSDSVTTTGDGWETKYYHLSCAKPENHTHNTECYIPGHTHTDKCYISETPVCGKDEVAHTDTCYTWSEITYNYYAVIFVPNNGDDDIVYKVVPELPEQFPVPITFPEVAYEKHKLDGWYVDSAFETPASLDSLSGAVTFYAKWTENPTERDIEYAGVYEIEVGKNIDIEGTDGRNHKWESSNPDIAVITKTDKEEIRVRGEAEGTVTITHSYQTKKNGPWYTEVFKVTVAPTAPVTYTVRFSANGASGTAPESVSVKAGESITLPDQGNLRSSNVFVGWSNGSNPNSGSNYLNQFIYPAGSSYTVTEDITLYAIFVSQGVTGTFYIRTDGQIPHEPGNYPSSAYTSGIVIENVIKVATFTSGESAVLDNLRTVPSTEQIKGVLPSYDPSTQYVQWYVIKPSINGWHIDGVLLKQSLINLTYDPNCVGYAGSVPIGTQHTVNEAVKVERGTITRTGYTFAGWNTEADGSGTAYQPEETFTITKSTTLYAQWIPNGNTKYTIEHHLETEAGSGQYTLDVSQRKYGRTDSEARAIPNTYDGYEYNAAKSTATGTILPDGTLVLTLYYDKLPTYGVRYQYITPGLPETVAATIPSDDSMYQVGTSVSAEQPNKISISIEENGVVTGRWDFNGWDAETKDMTEGGIIFTGTWTYTESGKGAVTHVYSGELPQAVLETLPTDSTDYYIGATVTPMVPTDTTVQIKNADNIVTDTYTFVGWDKQRDTMVSGGVTFTGAWNHAETAKAGVTYVYSQQNLPAEVTATLPSDTNQYYIGTKVDAKSPTSTTIDIIKDGIKTGTYTFEGWDEGNRQSMDADGITFAGTWSYEAATKYGVTYNYVAASGTLPSDISAASGTYAVSDSESYHVGATVTRKNTIPVGTTYDVTKNGVKIGTWTLTSWNKENVKMTAEGVTFTGTWTYEAARQYTLTYVVDGSSVKTDTLYAGQTIRDYSYAPDAAYLEFRGWYSDAGCTTNTTVPGTMPAHDLTVYGKTIYQSYDYMINYFYQDENGTTYTQDTSATREAKAQYNTVISAIAPVSGIKAGFVLGHTDPVSGSITIGTGSNVLNVYYDRGQYEYTIEYYYDSVLDEDETVTDTAAFGSTISYTEKSKPGFKFESASASSITIGTGSNVIRVYYVKDSIGYTVNYYYDGILDSSKTEQLNAKFESVISTYPEKRIDGYKLDKTRGLPLTISSEVTQNVISVYYIKDTFDYTIKYYKQGETAPFATTAGGPTAFESVITKASIQALIDQNCPDGYAYASDTAPLTITSTPSSNVIQVIYAKADYAYTIRYFKDNAAEPFATSPGLSAKFNSVIEKASITSYAADKCPDGYKYASDTAPLTISSDTTKNVVDVYYVKDTFSYTVEYYYDGVKDEGKTESGVALFGVEITNYVDKNIDGYKLDKTENQPLTISSVESNNVIRIYYIKNEFGYSVHYFYDDIEAPLKVETGTKKFGESVEYTDKIIDGYQFSHTTPASGAITISSNTNKNRIDVYYTKRTDLSYTVKYYYNLVEDANLQLTVTDQTFGSTILPGNVPTGDRYLKSGYVFDSMSISNESPLSISTDDNVIHVYYVKGDYPYSIVLHHDGLDNLTIPGAATEFEAQITWTHIQGTVESRIKPGYKYAATPYENVPLTITHDESQNVIHVYLVKDSFGYAINHIYEGDESLNYSESDTAIFGSTIGYTANEKNGYKFSHDDATDGKITISHIDDDNVINVYYVKDTFGYSVEYYYDGVIDSSKTVTGEATFQDVIDSYTDKVIDGYKLDETKPVNVPLTVSSNPENNVIRVYYVKDAFDYSVEYYYDGVIDSSKTVTGEATFQDVIDSYTDKVIDGYKLDETKPVNVPLTVSSNPENNVIRVYYVKDAFGYSVEYYYDGIIDSSKTVTGEATFQDVIDSYANQVIRGYELETVTGFPLTVSSNPDSNVIRVYYVKSEFNYTVEYYYDGIRDDSATVTSSAKFQDVISTYPNKAIDGYVLSRDTAPLTIGTDDSLNVIRVYYVKGEFDYRVEYYYDYELDESATEYGTATYEDVIDTFTHKYGLNYRFAGTSNFPLTIGSDADSNVIRVYYVSPEPEIETETEPEQESDPEPESEEPTESGSETEEPLEDIPDENVPLGQGDGLLDIPDEDVPLANIPKTGDENELLILAGALGISSIALAILLLKGRRRKDSESK